VKDLAAAQNPPVHEIAVVENAPAEIPAALATETPKPVKKTFAEAALTKSPAAVPAAPAPQVVKLDAVKAADSAAVEKAANDHLQLVIFVLNRQYYGVDIAIVESIIKMQTVTRLPKAQPYVRGLTNLRGMVLPVFDLRKRFNLAEQNTTHTSRIVVVRVNQAKIGMVVDEVSEVMTDHNCTLEPAPAIAMSIDTTFIKGIAKVDERLIIVLDLTKVITQPEKKARTKV
jgi:purine-binding chemotaxis protein CheW